MLLLLPASCLLTSIAGHLVPCLLVPKHPVSSLLFSPLSFVPPALLEFTSSIHLASLLPRQHLHRTVGAPALLRSPISPLVPQLPSLPSCSHLFPAHVLLGLLSWFSPNTPSHQLVVLSSGHFFPAPLLQCTGILVTHLLSTIKLVLWESFWALLSGASLTLCPLRSLGPSAAAGC